MEEVAKSLEQNFISLKASTAKSKGMVNSTSSPTCNKCKRTDDTTQNCKSKHCSLCDQYFHNLDQCFLNPKSPNCKGDVGAAQYWKKLG